MTFLPGLADVVHDEVVRRLRPTGAVRPVTGRDDALTLDLPGWDRRVLGLRTAVAVWAVVHLDVPRPRSLISGEHLRHIVRAVQASIAVEVGRTFRFEAAGSDAGTFARLGSELAAATGLTYRPLDGELAIRVRRPPATSAADPGWDVLVRIGARPLSARRWRQVDYPGALNATIAAAMVVLAGSRPADRVANLMCGSGTLLVERLLAGPAATAVGVDLAEPALAAARTNLAAAGVDAELVLGDATDPRTLGSRTFDLLLADPPWGDLHGSGADADRVHTGRLAAAAALAAPGARCMVVTGQVTVMNRAVRAAADRWDVDEPRRVFAKGHHPRLYLLRRR